jgi:hypothetical protein
MTTIRCVSDKCIGGAKDARAVRPYILMVFADDLVSRERRLRETATPWRDPTDDHNAFVWRFVAREAFVDAAATAGRGPTSLSVREMRRLVEGRTGRASLHFDGVRGWGYFVTPVVALTAWM